MSLAKNPEVINMIRKAAKTGQPYREVATKIGCSPRYVSYIAEQIGIPHRHLLRARNGWSEPELDILKEHGSEETKAIQRRLAKIGSNRTLTAIQAKRHALRIAGLAPGREARNYYVQDELATLVGVDNRKVQRWIRQKLLKARHFGEKEYTITLPDLRRFLLDNPGEWDPGRCDKYWLVDVLRGGA